MTMTPIEKDPAIIASARGFGYRTVKECICKEVRAGTAGYVIAEMLGCSSSIIYMRIQKWGVKSKKAIKEAQICRDYQKLCSLAKVAEKHRISSPTVKTVLLNHGVTLRARGGVNNPTGVGLKRG